MESVKLALRQAKEYGLETEVVYTALWYIKNNPQSTIAAALEYALGEWIK